MNTRGANLIGAMTCAGLMGYALYAQYALELTPCPLCIFQRVAVIALGLVFLVAALHAPTTTGSRGYAILSGLIAAAGIGVAGRHVWLTTLPPERVPACGPGLDFMLQSFPLRDALSMILAGSGECASVEWRFLGLSMPMWVLIALLGLGGWGIYWNWRGRVGTNLRSIETG